ncbi:hypothetical protein [Frateuria sp. STR12]|uniref:hypothetical protein n=1 Tax=Frateuria hangzhouensis TaxID=2995589 RepID=UPI002260CD98|nr:hypothetical protein [Frateuria sp. STR12]MCX7512160.1 hypothetical protein [Frateuria sp. STR12]
MSEKSEAIVGFIANLMPLYQGERYDGDWCARSLTDGTLILPVDESGDEEEEGWLRVRWQGDSSREQEVQGFLLASVALERYVRFHGTGFDEEALAGELGFMAEHFTFKTGCHVYLPQLPDPPSRLTKIARGALTMEQGVLVNVFSKVTGFG